MKEKVFALPTTTAWGYFSVKAFIPAEWSGSI
jgi:hypothetical protein